MKKNFQSDSYLNYKHFKWLNGNLAWDVYAMESVKINLLCIYEFNDKAFVIFQ